MITNTSALVPIIELTGLEVYVGPATLWINGFIINTAPTILFLAGNATSYVFLNFTTGLIQVNTAGFENDYLPIATVVTNRTSVVTLVDQRPDWSNIGGGGSGPSFSDGEVPSGSINGSNVTFTLLNAPSPGESLVLMRNGIVQGQDGAQISYSLSSNTITFSSAPLSGDTLVAWYRY